MVAVVACVVAIVACDVAVVACVVACVLAVSAAVLAVSACVLAVSACVFAVSACVLNVCVSVFKSCNSVLYTDETCKPKVDDDKLLSASFISNSSFTFTLNVPVSYLKSNNFVVESRDKTLPVFNPVQSNVVHYS